MHIAFIAVKHIYQVFCNSGKCYEFKLLINIKKKLSSVKDCEINVICFHGTHAGDLFVAEYRARQSGLIARCSGVTRQTVIVNDVLYLTFYITCAYK